MKQYPYFCLLCVVSIIASTPTPIGKKSTPTTLTTSTTDASKTTKTTAKSTTTTTTSRPTTTSARTSDASPTPLPNSLSEKLDYQIYQTRLLTGIVEDNRLALKRLVGMMSHLLDNSGQSPANDSSHIDSSLDEKKKPVPTSSNLPQKVQFDNDSLHVSFGNDADPNRYPWAVAIRGNDRDRCGGTLIDDQHVLTAAHCIGTRTTTVSLGSHLYDGGEEVKTSFFCVHRAYSSSNYYRNDLAVIRLTKPVSVQLPRRVATIKICNRTSLNSGSISSNTANMWMVGWGLKNNEIEPDELQEAQVALADASMCKGSKRYVDLCVQSRSNTSPMGACTGDSGSGLFQHTVIGDKWCLMGVASSSNTDICEQTQYTTYAQASSADYVEWFRDVLDKKKTFDELQKIERCKARTWGQEFCQWYAC